jgi:hypothetical protein
VRRRRGRGSPRLVTSGVACRMDDHDPASSTSTRSRSSPSSIGACRAAGRDLL